MLILNDAVKISIEKVIQSAINIVTFQHVYAYTKLYFNALLAFIITAFLVAKIKSFVYDAFVRAKIYAARTLGIESKILLESERQTSFNDSDLMLLDLNLNSEEGVCVSDSINSMLAEKFHSDLFNFIFSSASQSSLLNLAVVLIIEYLVSKYEIAFLLAMFYALACAFLLCFLSSLKYASLLSDEWSTENRNRENVSDDGRLIKKEILMYEGQIVALVELKYDLRESQVCFEFKHVSSKYLNRLEQMLKHVLENDMKNENSNSLFDNFGFLLPDYYNLNYELSNALRKQGFITADSWIEFRLLPMINFKKTFYKHTKKERKETFGHKKDN